ncbi:peptide chain release factor 1 [Iamia sp.]|uniref:peptide chain release factor 1 n=1 Tax=Iamia sp. TaxID=2722710 RepID=UPI002CC10CD1|nr:peptide chain release factor 1 [Iamia sp.]HXH58011.1 peptide chain release factor 1 [Iamia sp.]
MLARLNDLARELLDVEARLSDPDTYADQVASADLARRHKELEAIVSRSRLLAKSTADLATAREMYAEADGDDRALLRSEIEESEAAVARLTAEIRLLLLPRDPNDDRNVIVEIRGAEGGEEGNLFARDLFEMYKAWSARRGWVFEVLGAEASDMGGYDEVTFQVKGDGVWSRLKHEGGPHRVQRVPATEAKGRVHTSIATVTVLPEADEVDVTIDPGDLQVDVYRSSGPGGQSVNTTDSAVRITHLPTGLVVSMQDEKSQLQNKDRALRVLRSRLLKAEQDRQAAVASEARRSQVGGGGRSEKIRTYNLKENRVTDHRIGLTLYRLEQVLAGDLDDLNDALVAADQAERMTEG